MKLCVRFILFTFLSFCFNLKTPDFVYYLDLIDFTPRYIKDYQGSHLLGSNIPLGDPLLLQEENHPIPVMW